MGNEKLISTTEQRSKEKEIYFIILRSKEEIVDFDLKFTSENAPNRIYQKNIKKGNGSFLEHNVFKLSIKKNEKEKKEKDTNNYKIEYIEGKKVYDILFSTNGNTFVYNVELKRVNVWIGNIVDQKIIPFYKKLDIFLDALKKNGENNKIEKLYKETIDLYKEIKNFSLLISLFLKTYKKNKDLCSKLLKVFNEINEKGNTDRGKELISNLDTFNQIYSNADTIIKNNGYDPINFYGILFCYLSYYDSHNFSTIIKEFSKGNAYILYEILIIYYSHFKIPLNQDKEFYNNFIGYAIKKEKKLNILERILNYIDDIETFIYVINENKSDIFKKYDDIKIKPIKLSSNLKVIKTAYNNKDEIDNIIKLTQEIIQYSENNDILIILLKSEFWINLLQQYNKPDLKDINNCYCLREVFKEYNNLINKLYKDTNDENKKIIKKDINKYYLRDEFAFILNNNITKYLEIKDDALLDQEKLSIIVKYNPYYNIENKDDIERYKNHRETSIFNNINFNNPTKEFKEIFNHLNFEKIFEENITEFINKIVSKIEDISTFGTVMELIDTKRLENEKKHYYYNLLKEKFDLIIKIEIKTLKGEELYKAIKILSKFISRIFLEEDNNSFLDEKIAKLDDKIKSLIYKELIETYNDKKYEKMKQYIYDIFLNKLDDIDNIIKFMDSLKEEHKKDFLEELMKKCEFTKEEFYSNSENKKIKLLCNLNEKGKLEIRYNYKIESTLDKIRNDLKIEKGLILKNKLEQFLSLNNEEKKIIVIQKLGLIKLILENYDPIKKNEDLKKFIHDINEKIQDLNLLKNSLKVFHNKIYEIQIKELANIIKDIENKPIKEFQTQKMKEDINELMRLKPTCDEINKVKDLLLFKRIFEKSKGKDQAERFHSAKLKLDEIKYLFKRQTSSIEQSLNIEIILQKFENIFNNIKEELGKKEESKSNEFIEQMVDYFDIKKEETKEDLSILIKSKKYEMIIKSIKFFFENFSNKKISLPKNIQLSEMNLEDLKQTLKKIKDDNIYDYQSSNPFYKVFISFYEKKEAIDFLMSKINTNIDNLKEKLDPTIRNISIKDIEDTIECLNHFKELLNLKDSKILEYIKDLPPETIEKFINYSKHYLSIIELDRKPEKDIFEDVYKIVEDANLIFELDNEYFYYKSDGKSIAKNINKLIDLKNKIIILPENKQKTNEEKKDSYQIKCDKLIFFKNIISNLEVIYDKIKILRIKGINIPIIINILIKYPKITYKLYDKEKEFNDIKEYLFMIKNDYENQLNIIYQNEKYLRFIYGKLFRKIKMHQEGNCGILGIIRYILNKIDYKDKIEDGEIYNVELFEDYENEYKYYTENIFDNISKYMISLFKKNDLDYQKHYEKMLIKVEKKNKGFYIFKCGNLSMEEYILYLFQEKLKKLPIAQNILICNHETSIEEMQSFFSRAILCDYNSLFIIELSESFSNFQNDKMFSYIDKLFSYKLEISQNKKINKSNLREFLNSCIIFVYKTFENESALVNELKKYDVEIIDMEESSLNDDEKVKREKYLMGDLNILNALNNPQNGKISEISENIKIISSDVCGLGKSFKIKKLMKEKNEIYYHFPLGGILTKKSIYEKILKLFQKIKKDTKIKKDEKNNKNNKDEEDEEDIKDEEYLDFNNVAIHLDLLESKETVLINEFLFSFLITKFYNYNEDILYIPNNIKIYVEIPNSFENYLTKYGILNVFKKEHIKLGKLPKLELEEDIKQIFKNMIGKETNEQIEEFVKDNIGIKEYSYHQVETFIKLFISQFRIFKSKLNNTNTEHDNITNNCIKYFAENTKYFTNGGFQKLILCKKGQIKDKTDLSLDAYYNDLNNLEFKTPLEFIDEKMMNLKMEMLADISEEEDQDTKEN